MKAVGIDLSANPRNCGVCVLENNVVTSIARGSGDTLHPDWLVGYCSGAQVVAVDVPFGWPKPLARALGCHKIGVALDRDRTQYLYRTTDSWLTNHLPSLLARDVKPPKPFAVGADKLGVTAMVGTVLLNGLSGAFNLSPRNRAAFPAVVEVYPAISLWAWGLPHRNYKGTNDSALSNRRSLLSKLEESFKLIVSKRDAEILVSVEHCFDALVAAMTGREYADGNTFDPPESFADDVLRTEGWVRVPNRLLNRNP